mgnify:CR=1 FL=1
MDVTVTPGWADKLKAGSRVIVEDHEVPADRPCDGYRIAIVERVSSTEVVVNGNKYRRGKGRSDLISYPNEGLEIERLNDPTWGRIWPVTAPVRKAYAKILADDARDALDKATAAGLVDGIIDAAALLRTHLGAR